MLFSTISVPNIKGSTTRYCRAILIKPGVSQRTLVELPTTKINKLGSIALKCG